MNRSTPDTTRFDGPRGPLGAVCVFLVALTISAAASSGRDIEPHAVEVSADLELRVNIPAFRLDAVVGGDVVASFPVTVGAIHEPTPDGSFLIDKVIWNPWWHPPAHRRPKDEVTPPGPRNPMGRVKLHFAADLYYVHGTAKTGELRRSTSRGCIRLGNEDAIAVAALVHDLAGPELEEAELARLMRNSSRTRQLPLDRPVPLRIVYDVVEIEDGHLTLHDDVYRRWEGVPTSDVIRTALAAGGIDPARVDVAALEAALEDSPELPISAEAFLVEAPETDPSSPDHRVVPASITSVRLDASRGRNR